MENPRIYNGTNHKIDFYCEGNYINARYSKKIITKGAKPYYTLPQQDALSSREQLSRIGVCENNIPVLERVVSDIDQINDSHLAYDYIVVSQLYSFCLGKTAHPLLLSRIYTTEIVYDNDDINKPVGAAGIIKAYSFSAYDWACWIQQYYNRLIPLNWFSVPNLKIDLEKAKSVCFSQADTQNINIIQSFLQNINSIMQPGIISPDG